MSKLFTISIVDFLVQKKSSQATHVRDGVHIHIKLTKKKCSIARHSSEKDGYWQFVDMGEEGYQDLSR
jgi:hypothetical protein